jgi:hypothetical protein
MPKQSIDYSQFETFDVNDKNQKIDYDQFEAFELPKSNQQLNDEYIKLHENDTVTDRLKDTKRWQAMFMNTGPYAQEIVVGTAPMVAPAGMIPKIAKYANALNNGKGLGYAAARTGLATGQGAVMSAFGGSEDDTIKDRLNNIGQGAKLSGAIQAGAESIPYVGKAIKAGSTKLGSAISGISENIVENYGKRTDQVNKLISQSGGDLSAGADIVRKDLSAGIQNYKNEANKQIGNAISASQNSSVVDETPIINALKKSKEGLNPNFDQSSISEIDDMISRVQAEAQSGRAGAGLSAKGLYEAKKFLNEASKSSYVKNGQMFTRSSAAARAANQAAREARNLVKEYLPEIADADKKISKLYQIEGRLNKNLIAEGKSDSALFAAGAGENPRNAATLRELEKLTNVPVMQRAKDLATAKEFANPALLPRDMTGKSVARMALGGAIGAVAGDEKGAAIGAGLASPFALKYAINAGNLASKIGKEVPDFARFARENPVAAQSVVQLIRGSMNKIESESKRQPKKLVGEQLWIKNGNEKLGLNLSNPNNEQKKLLIEASDLPMGSKKLELIKTKLKDLGE